MAENKRRIAATEPDDEPDRFDDDSSQPAKAEGPPSAAPRSVAELESRLEEKEKECRESIDKLLRVSAEFENYKKRAAREMDDFRKYANQSLLKEMLSALDHIELAILAASAKAAAEPSIAEGLTLTLKEFLRIFEKFGVKAIEAQGKPFNPEVHEAMLREESETIPENMVLRELQKGYTIGQRLLRPSLVVVSAAPAAAS
jgi:molecular chaperone GrpE